MTEIKVDERGREQVKAWYALVVYPGRELKIRDKLAKLAATERLRNQIFQIMVPAIKEEKVDAKGKTKIKENMIYTQYVYVEMILNDDTYHAVKIDGVRHILGAPTPISESEVQKIFAMMGETFTSGTDFSVGDTVQILDKDLGALYLQDGEIHEVDNEEKEVKITINLAGNETEMTVRFDQIGKK